MGVLFCSIQCSSSSVCLVFAVVCDLRILLAKPLAATSAWTLPYHTLRKKININNRKSADFLNPFGLKELFPWQSMPRVCSNTYIAPLFCTKTQRRQKNAKNQNSAAARDENLDFFWPNEFKWLAEFRRFLNYKNWFRAKTRRIFLKF